MYCSYSRSHTRAIEGKIEDLQCDMKQQFENAAVKLPEIISDKINLKDDKFTKVSDNIAVYVSRPYDNELSRVYEFDFLLQLATIMTVQQDSIIATETKKFNEMPAKMLGKAQAVLKTNYNSIKNISRRSV